MNLFELLWFLFFVGGGALLGYRLWHAPGAVIGLVVGALLMWLVLSLVHRLWKPRAANRGTGNDLG